MKKIFPLLLITLLCCGFAIAVQQPAEWTKLDSAEGRFRAVMPSKPEPTVNEVDSAVGKTNLYIFSASSPLGSFMISYSDYPNPASSPEHAQRVLDGVRDGVLKGIEANLISETNLTLNGNPGREMRATRVMEGTEMTFSWRTYLVGRRLYQLGVGTRKVDAESNDISRFFQSFELVN